MLNPPAGGLTGAIPFGGVGQLDASVNDVVAVSPEVKVKVQVVSGNHNWSTDVYGESPEYFGIREWPLDDGASFTDLDVRGANKVVDAVDNVKDRIDGNPASKPGPDPTDKRL